MYKVFPLFFVALAVAGVVVCARSAANPPEAQITDATVKIFLGTRR